MTEKTLADAIRDEGEAVRRCLLHHARPRGLMGLEEAIALCEDMAAGQHNRHVIEWEFRRRIGLTSLHQPMVVLTGV